MDKNLIKKLGLSEISKAEKTYSQYKEMSSIIERTNNAMWRNVKYNVTNASTSHIEFNTNNLWNTRYV